MYTGDLGIGLALQDGDVRELNLVEMVAPEPPIAEIVVWPKTWLVHRRLR